VTGAMRHGQFQTHKEGNLCDFNTGQAAHRMAAMNLNGVFTRDLRLKLAARRLRQNWPT
jgi:hypothetical protein